MAIDTIDCAYYSVADGAVQTTAHVEQAVMWVDRNDRPRSAVLPT
jgi:hypothetical protein